MRRSLTLLAVALLLAALAPVAGAAEEPTVTDEVVASQADGTEIAITVFQPAGASATSRVPVVLDSHGWGGSRRTGVDGTVQSLLDGGFGVVSIDQRGHGDSGGQANVQDPELEAQDVKSVIDHVAAKPWVLLDGPGDPRLGAIGGSYGGGYQLMTALTEVRESGRTRFDALAPEITWHDLPESLAPSRVPRTIWNVLLYAVGARNVPPFIHRGFVEGMATNTMPESLAATFHEHSPKAFSDAGIRLDIPVLFGQGTTDNLFPLNEGWKNFERILTPSARARSRFIAYNGGHALPNVLPPGAGTGADACSPGGYRAVSVRFFRHQLLGDGPSLTSSLRYPYSLTTADGSRCVGTRSLAYRQPVEAGDVTTTAGAGPVQYVPLVEGEGTVAGIPRLRGTITTVGLDARVFVGLAVGTSPSNARVVQNNLLPLRRVEPVADEAFRLELPGVVVDLGEGQTLYLVVTTLSDMFVGNGSRTPALVRLMDLVVDVPRPQA
jgi:ABC-2 type transport system ATP-binding protein